MASPLAPQAALDLSPRPGAASLRRQVVTIGSVEAKLLLRNGEQLLISLVIPVMILLAGVAAGDRLDLDVDERMVDLFTPGVITLAIIASSFTALAITTGFERRYGVIKFLGATPLPRIGFLLGKVVALACVLVVQLIVIGGVGQLLGWEPEAGVLGIALAIVLGIAAFTSWAMLLAGTVRPEGTLALANLLFLLFMAAGAVVLPASLYGPWGDAVQWLPTGALGETVRAAFVDGTTDWAGLGVLALWAAAGTALTARFFRWE